MKRRKLSGSERVLFTGLAACACLLTVLLATPDPRPEPARIAPIPAGVPCPGEDSTGYELTKIYPDGGFRCDKKEKN